MRKKLSISLHKWRQTFATRFVKKNGNMEVLRQIMGHTSLRTTQKYLQIDKDVLHKEYLRVSSIN
ncbi:MAG: tyrosine-type recombinase/integrase [Tenericutes bacterium]|nr:tyrosine-type recombinase/integrase [Mycoplasmatota bacterium]